MIRGPTRLFLRVIGVAVILAAVGTGFALWQLSRHPWSLGFAKPYIEKALSDPASGRVVTVGDTLLVWDREQREVAIQLRNLVVGRGEGRPVLTLPDTNVRLGIGSLLTGRVAPTEISILRPVLHAVRAADGTILVGVGDMDPQAAQTDPGDGRPLGETIRSALAGDDRAPEILRSLRQVRLVGASVSLDDRQLNHLWQLTGLDIELDRGRRGVQAGLRSRISVEGMAIDLTANALWQPSTDLLQGEVRAEGLNPSGIAPLAPALAQLAPLDAVLSASARFEIYGSGRVRSVDVSAKSADGRIVHPQLTAKEMRVRDLLLTARYADDAITLSEFHATLDKGVGLRATANARDLSGATAIEGKVAVTNVPIDDLPVLWPVEVAPNPRRWITANLSRGTVKSADAEFKAGRKEAGQPIDPVTLKGTLAVEGARVTYFGKLPAVEKVDATGTFDLSRLDITVATGQVRGLKLEKTLIQVTGLDAPDQRIGIDLDVGGPLSDALFVLDQAPLNYMKKFGQKPETIQGDAKLKMGIGFPLLDALKVSQIGIKIEASVANGRVPKLVRNLDLTDGQFTLQATESGLEMTGQAKLGPIPARLGWVEQFADKVAFRRRFTAQATVDSAQRAAVGLDAEPYLSGPMDVNAELTDIDGKGTLITGSADLKAVAMKAEEIGWAKKPGAPGMLRFELAMRDQKLQTINALSLSSAGLDLQGSGQFGGDGKLTRFDIKRLKSGETDMAARLDLRPDGFDLVVKGPSFDASALMEQAKAEDTPQPPPPDPRKRRIQAQLDKVIVGPGRTLSAVRVEAHSDGKVWNLVDLKANVGSAPIAVLIQPLGTGRTVTITTADAGQVLKAFDVTDNVLGGNAVISGRFDGDSDRLVAHLDMTDYRVVKAPILGEVLAVASITGIPQLLTGEGIAFSSMVADITRDATKWEISDARAAGLALGINVRGTMNRQTSELDLSGTIVPIYTLNRVIGAIPLLGDLLTGGDGGGLFAWTYRVAGPIDQPKVSVNPLSALAPGFLRKLFEPVDPNAPALPDKPREPGQN